MLDWINATLPDKDISNFTTDWNNGINLSALVDYCKPGLIPNHATLEPSNPIENISNAMALAEEQLGIPKLMQPDDLAAESPDERSVMTYLSYFCGPASPGQEALLSWIQKQIPSQNVTNFTTDWVNGEALGMLVNVVSASAFPSYDQYKHTSKEDEVGNCRKGMDAAEELLGIESTLKAEEFANPEFNPLSRATYLIQFYHAKLSPDASKVAILETPSGNLNAGDHIKISFDTSTAGTGTLTASCEGNEVGEVAVSVSKTSRQNFDVMFVPPEEDVYTISVLWADSHIRGSPFAVNLKQKGKPDASKCKIVSPHTTTSLGSKIVGLPNPVVYTLNKEVSFEIDTAQAGKGSLTVTAISQEGVGTIPHIEPIPERPCVFKVRYTPTTPGTHTLDLLWANEAIPSSPLSFEVIDASLVPLGIPIVINMTAYCRKRHLKVYAIHHEKNAHHKMKIEKLEKSHFHLTFKPKDEGLYHVHVLHQDKELPGSPLHVQCSKEIKPTSKEDGHIEFVVDALLAGLDDGDSGDVKYSTIMTAVASTIAPMSAPSPESVTLTAQVRDGSYSPGELSSSSISENTSMSAPASPERVTLTQAQDGSCSPGELTFPKISPMSVPRPASPEVEIEIVTLTQAQDSSYSPRELTSSKISPTSVPASPEFVTLAQDGSYSPRELTSPKVSPMSILASPESVTPTKVQDGSYSPGELISEKVSSTDLLAPTGGTNLRGEFVGLKLENENFRVGLPYSFKLHCEDLGKEAPEITCKPPSGAEINLSPAPGENSHWVEIVPKKAGKYELSVKFNGKHILGSPFSVQFSSRSDASKCVLEDSPPECQKKSTGSPFAVEKDKPDASMCKIVSPLTTTSLGSKIVGIPNSAVYALNKEISFEIDTSQAGKGHLTVTAISQEGVGTTPHIEPIPERPRVFKVRYTPTTPGTHTLDLLWANEAIPSSPLSFEVIDAKLVPLGIPIVTNMTAHCRKRHLKVYAIHHEKNTKHEMKIDKLDKSHFHLTFKPKDEGLYHVHVLHQDKELPGSPLHVQCSKEIKPTTKEDGHIEFVVDALLAGLDEGDFGVMTHSTVVTAIASTVALVSAPASLESATLTQVLDCSYPLGELTSRNISEKASPTELAPTGKTDFERVAGLNLENEKFRVGLPYSFKLHCEDLGKEAPEIACKPPSGAEINLSPAPGENSHWVEIVPKKAGKHELSVKFNGKHILGSPFNVQFSSRSDASKCVLEDSPPECQKMSAGAENIIFCVSNKGAGKGKLTAVVKSNTTKETLPVSITRPLKHHYHVEFTPSEGLDYTLTIKYDDFNIPGSPFKLVLGDATKCRMEGEGTVEAWLNEQNRFTVNAQDAGPGQLEVAVEGDSEIVEPDISMPAEAVFEVGYQPSRRGMYSVSVKWGKLNIPGSPFQIKCCKRILASEIHITNPSAGAYIGKPLKLRLVAKGNEIDQEEKFTVFVRSSDGEEFPGMVERGESGSCVCTIDPPPRVGVYELHVLWTGEHIPGSPFDLEVAQQPEPSDFIVGAAKLEGGAMVVRVNGPKCAFRCGELTASVENPATTEVLPVTAVQLSHEECNIAFNPHKCGEYLLSILYDGNHVDGSPFRLIATNASLCYIKGKGLTAAQVGRENKFIVCTDDAGPGELKVDVEGHEGDDEFKVLIFAASKTRYDVNYTPPAPGRYKVSVQWDNNHIPGSPFEVLCVDATRYSVVKPPDKISLGKVIRVGVKVVDHMPPVYEKLDIFACSKDNHTFEGEIRESSDGNYTCTVMPPELGMYRVHVHSNGLDIPGSPFKTKVMAAPVPENVRAYGEGLADGVIGQERLFTARVSDAGYGYLCFRVEGPKKGFYISLDRRNEDGLIFARYTPIYAGDYTISLLWSGVHIPGSPFHVTIDSCNARFLKMLYSFVL